ncbi:RNA 2'-phosphotransferase [Tundrisphaera sp. TA3]|uniref:RNA 2'-phosphotransferase n=1 Tax=Tundrisphaera sp. TA3 TaxID=3435775 RepID=UPI003EB6A0E4
MRPGHTDRGRVVSARAIRVSKYLSKYLRHSPEELGLSLLPGGWVPVDDLLAAAASHGFPISYDELVEVVETNDKRRFSFDDGGDRIRANQGHSVAVDLQLEEKEPPDLLYHGTVERSLPSILSRGLIRGDRHHVHLSSDRETARRVGARRGRPVVLEVAAGRMHRDGIAFFVSANGVWLVDAVPPGYLARA